MTTRREILSFALAFPVVAAAAIAHAQSGAKPLASQWGSSTIRALDFSPDGRSLAAVGDLIRVWDLGGDSRAKQLPGDNWNVDHVAFLRDGRSLICGDMNGVLLRVDLGLQKEAWRTRVGEEVLSLVAAPDGGSFFCGLDEHLQQRSALNGALVKEFGPEASIATDLAVAPNGAWLAAFRGDETRALVVWNVASGAVARRFPIAESAYAAAFARDSRSLSWIARAANVFTKSTAQLTDGTIATKAFHLPEAFSDTSGSGLSGNRLIASTEGAAVIWDIARDIPVWSATTVADEEARAFGLSDDGKTIAFAEPDGSATLRDVAGGALLRRLVF